MSDTGWPIIGIDVGTTFSCVAIWKSQKERAEIILNESGTYTTPSMVAFTDNERFVGIPAKNQAAMNPKNTVYDSKRLMGRKYSDQCIQSGMEIWPFRIVKGREDRPLFDVEFEGKGKQFTAEEISAMILSHMKGIAEAYLGRNVTNAVVTVPAYFNDAQRCATADAAKIAGLNVVRIINEPTAAALAYGLDKIHKKDDRKKVLIFDLGGGTLDVTLLDIDCDVIEVLAKSGDTHLGGQDFDSRLVKYFTTTFKQNHRLDISNSPRALARLRIKCEEVKRMLSTKSEDTVYIDSLYGGIDLYEKLSRAKFEDLNTDLFEKCINIVKLCLKEANTNASSIDDVVLVGGSSRIPKIQALLKESLRVNSFCKSINPDEAVAYGAAVQAAMLGCAQTTSVPDIVLRDATPLSLGISDHLGIMYFAVPRNTVIPTTREHRRATVEDYQKDVVFRIYEGERANAADNNFLGEFHIYDIPRSPKGEVEFTVRFHIDANSILTVSAVETRTGMIGRITVRYDRGRLTKEEIDRMVQEAEKYKEDDDRRKEVALAKDEFESVAFDLKKHIENHRCSSMLDAAAEKRIQECQQEVREALEWSENSGQEGSADDYHRKKNLLSLSWEVAKSTL